MDVMSAMHHDLIAGSDCCVYCLETWPCQVARIRRELAEEIRNHEFAPIGDPDWEIGKEAGLESAADLIDAEGF